MSQATDYTFAYQPILGLDQSIVAMELLYRPALIEKTVIADDTIATAYVITNLFLHGEMDSLIGPRNAFINVGKDLLLSDMLLMLPRDKITIELLETIPVSRQVIERCHKLKAMGFTLALDDMVGNRIDELTPLLEIVDIVKVDMLLNSRDSLVSMTNKLKHWRVQLLAEKVETLDDFKLCRDLGYSLFQGYYFARPTIVSGKRPDPDKLTVLDLLSKLKRDTDNRVIEEAFKPSPALTLQLLRLVNCAAYSVGIKINSIHQAISLFGRDQLVQWLQILLFSLDDANDFPSPLFEIAVRRGRLMDLMSLSPTLASVHDQAHMVGILSLADSLMGIPMQDILGKLGLAPKIEKALLEQKGTLGNMLKLCQELEQANFNAVEKSAKTLGISLHQIMRWQNDAITWVNQFTLNSQKNQR